VFQPEEDRPNANQVVVLSHAAWKRLFGQDAGVIGRTIELNQMPYRRRKRSPRLSDHSSQSHRRRERRCSMTRRTFNAINSVMLGDCIGLMRGLDAGTAILSALWAEDRLTRQAPHGCIIHPKIEALGWRGLLKCARALVLGSGNGTPSA
jgi:hypothetical protein